jgi:AcrR family transcriptional regulator
MSTSTEPPQHSLPVGLSQFTIRSVSKSLTGPCIIPTNAPRRRQTGLRKKPAQATAAAKSGGRPRDDASREAILQATHALLEEAGFDKLSIEGIAARAGVAKTTIYRWWPQKGVLAIEAFLAAVSPELAFPETGSAIADLRAQVQNVARLYRGKTGRIICELVALSQADPVTCRAFTDGYMQPRRRAAKDCLQRGIAQGELRPGLDADQVLDMLYGPIWYRMLMRHGPLDPAYIDAHLDLVLTAIARPREGSSRKRHA